MKVLFVVGTCLSKNTSANMSHNSYIQGLLENGAEVEVIMKNDSWGQADTQLKKFEGVKYTEYGSESVIDKIIDKFRSRIPVSKSTYGTVTANCSQVSRTHFSLRDLIKKIVFTFFPKDKVYPLDKVWLSNAKRFISDTKYDLIVSNSSPSASHKLAQMLIESGNVKTKRWIQIWEDPWFYDLYGGNTEDIREEEQRLLDSASEIYYVSPLTTEYQKKYFSSAASKMKTIPLPYFAIEDNANDEQSEQLSFGYFGDYYSYTRNLIPFFNVLKKSGRKGFIYGDTDLSLEADNIEISPRVTLDVLKRVQDKTSVLVHLSNLYGGQIPGKIYHYSSTTKPILFILDGTDEEKEILKSYFGKFNRYYFCDNTEESILSTIKDIESNISRIEPPIKDFSPKEVIKAVIK